MKRISKLLIIISFLIIPFELFAATTSISDNELDHVCAQIGSITVRMNEVIPVESQNLKNISTDGWNYWDPDHDRSGHIKNPHPNNAEGYFDGTTTTNPQKHPAYGKAGYFGYDEAYLYGGTVTTSGTMVIEITSTNNPNTSDCKLEAVMRNVSIDSPLGISAVMKLSSSPDLSGNQVLGRVYTQGIQSTGTYGHVTIFAHSNSHM